MEAVVALISPAPKQTPPEQVAKLGVKPDDVKFVGISHYHGDHTGGEIAIG